MQVDIMVRYEPSYQDLNKHVRVKVAKVMDTKARSRDRHRGDMTTSGTDDMKRHVETPVALHVDICVPGTQKNRR